MIKRRPLPLSRSPGWPMLPGRRNGERADVHGIAACAGQMIEGGER